MDWTERSRMKEKGKRSLELEEKKKGERSLESEERKRKERKDTNQSTGSYRTGPRSRRLTST